MSKRLELPRIGFEGSNDNMPFDRDQIYAHQGEAHPPIDDDALVENAVQNVKKGRLASRGSLNPHVDSLASAISEPVPTFCAIEGPKHCSDIPRTYAVSE